MNEDCSGPGVLLTVKECMYSIQYSIVCYVCPVF